MARRKSAPPGFSRVRSLGTARNAVAAGISLSENPNRGKRNAASLAYMQGFVAELARAESRAYSPLTVVTPARDSRGRRNTRMTPSSYTI